MGIGDWFKRRAALQPDEQPPEAAPPLSPTHPSSVVEFGDQGLFDLFVHAGTQALERCWRLCLDALPADAVAGLLAYAKAHPEPRPWHPLPQAKSARREAERIASAVQERLLRRLEECVLERGGVAEGSTVRWGQMIRRIRSGQRNQSPVPEPSPSLRSTLRDRDAPAHPPAADLG